MFALNYGKKGPKCQRFFFFLKDPGFYQKTKMYIPLNVQKHQSDPSVNKGEIKLKH